MRLHNKVQSLFNNPWVLLVVRVFNGGIFFLFAFGKAIQPHDLFYQNVAQYQLLPQSLIPVLGSTLIYIELVVGVLLLVGLFTRVSAVAAGAMMVMFMVFIVQALLRGITLVDCGCSGGLISLGDTPTEVLVRDMLMLGSLAWLLAARGVSALRVDALFEDKKGHML